jgi:hypothetical protein
MDHACPQVSVVIPVWGAYYVGLLAEAVASVDTCTVPAHIIVVDNACESPLTAPDGCEVVRSEERLSTGAARNLGLSFVKTEYVVFLDADDVLVPDALARLVMGLERRPASPILVAGIIDATGAPYRRWQRVRAILAGHPRAYAWCNAVWSITPTQGCAIVRTAAAREAGGYGDASIGEDGVLGASLAFRGPVAIDPEPALVYRAHEASPGVSRVSCHAILDSARRVRIRLRDDAAVAPGKTALTALMVAHVLAAAVARPTVRALRHVGSASAKLRGADASSPFEATLDDDLCERGTTYRWQRA